MKKENLRLSYVIPNALVYLLLYMSVLFFFANTHHLYLVQRSSIWVLTILFLFFISVLISFVIWHGIKEDKL
ncbi:hypothetical protein E2R51_11605 [Jeotgalibacillus sp. S-D1]|uniref:hypothetical protein n=1 Tax=Jeotgalibacillus sp. S-D1 TaxID=2552189 RepID=UPI001059BBAF|nr:hypothetical protein [Jeotgalibacillus sp. S-D1]TDL31859.1 hypothetical protein E2R51_11605 [Jeotgalibacillus sp. S-D1]